MTAGLQFATISAGRPETGALLFHVLAGQRLRADFSALIRAAR